MVLSFQSPYRRSDVNPPSEVQTGPFDLRENQVHLWTVRLDRTEDRHEAVARLSAEELRRAGTFHFERHRRRFIVRHMALRAILSAYLRVDPAKLRFTTGERGKPELDPRAREEPLHFNLSHSHEMALIGVTRSAPIGVDIEHVRPIPDLDALAARFFSPFERAVLRDVAPDRKLEAFLRCWTQKEAFVKATGQGLYFDLHRFDVSVSPDAPPAILRVDDDPDLARSWSVHPLPSDPHYVGAVVAEANPIRLSVRCWPWQSLR
ncbi:MAG: 4'-phosphopantetheinyl transferase superfamily protein [Gemmatimonadetes bacterium]|nr:4'-phosphopantetheinyl transferase superfamily protein [Gemmatimonadota bacterium]